MKNLLTIPLIALVATISSCNQSEKDYIWEYRVCRINGTTIFQEDSQGQFKQVNDYSQKLFYIPEIRDSLNVLGKAGWELVDVVPYEETAYPNFGTEEYHTGIKSNTRTSGIDMFFKRKKEKSEK